MAKKQTPLPWMMLAAKALSVFLWGKGSRGANDPKTRMDIAKIIARFNK